MSGMKFEFELGIIGAGQGLNVIISSYVNLAVEFNLQVNRFCNPDGQARWDMLSPRVR